MSICNSVSRTAILTRCARKKADSTRSSFQSGLSRICLAAAARRAVKRADVQIEAVRDLTKQHPETWELATTAADVRRIAASGKIAALMGLEGGYAIDEKIENVERYYQMGVRYMSPAWSVSTSWAGSSGDEVGKTRGLNDFGKQVIREMNRLGMMVDVSHLSDKAFWDIVNTSTKPVIATHSGCRAITNVPRNLTDEMIVGAGEDRRRRQCDLLSGAYRAGLFRKEEEGRCRDRCRWCSARPTKRRATWRRRSWRAIGCEARNT